MTGKYNFYAGPAILPAGVMKKAQAEFRDFNGIGLSVMEISHRSAEFDEVITSAEETVRSLLAIPDDYAVLFLQGGASLQFGMIPMNFLHGGTADYIHTGAWAKKAITEGKKFGTANIVASSEDRGFSCIPEVRGFTPQAAYVHLTSNETIGGIQWHSFPDTGDIPLIADMSSDILSRPLDITRFAMIYAGAQKNIGPAGVTLVIIRKDLVDSGVENLATMLSYRTHVEKKSLFNTPPTFIVYMVKLVLEWLAELGGVKTMANINEKKARLLYDTIDESDLYTGTAEKKDRSLMNVTFRLSPEDLEAKFLKEAGEAGFIGLKGHRSVGGCRASIYNAMPMEGVEKLADFMKVFQKRNG